MIADIRGTAVYLYCAGRLDGRLCQLHILPRVGEVIQLKDPKDPNCTGEYVVSEILHVLAVHEPHHIRLYLEARK